MLINRLFSYRSEQQKLKRRHALDRQTIITSGLFDADWYLSCYPDVAETGGDALDHYLRNGARERRAAGPRFDTAAYLAANPDVAANGGNALVHYIRHGLKEGRKFGGPRTTLGQRIGSDQGTKALTFSFLVAGGRPAALDATLKSLAALPGGIFEVILAETGPDLPRAAEALRARGRQRIDVRTVRPQGGGSFLRDAVAAARNDFIIVLEPGDVVIGNAVATLSHFLNAHVCDVVYSDESQAIVGVSDRAPALKPSWSPELLKAYNYFGRLTAIRRSIALTVLPESGTLDAAEWDLNLRVAERTQAIERLPMILCRRTEASSRDRRLPGEAYADHAAVLKAYWTRHGHDARISAASDGTLQATWTLSKRPLVSVIIPNKNRAPLLQTCTDGLYDKTAYQNFELIVVDNGSTDPETLALYERLEARSAKIIPYDETFNYSRACNLGASAAKGDLLLFLNNDIEMVEPDWLDELVRQVDEPGVGIVGPKLLYPDGEIQHAGVALGLFTLAAHVFHRAPKGEWGPFGSPDTTRNWMAVTGACQLVRRSVFDLIDGYDESFILSYSDIVLCADAARAGFRTVYLPASVLLHHEGASRGHTNPTNDQILFAKRIRRLGLTDDPYFHPALDTESFVPKFRSGVIVADPSPMQADIERLTGGPDRPLDVFDDGAVASAAGLSWRTAMWRFDPGQLAPDLQSATRILLEFIRRRPDLRLRFPRALSDGPAGGFASWVKTDGLALLGLGQEYADWIDQVFEADLGAYSRQILVYDEALRQRQPLFLLPTGREETCRALFAAAQDMSLTLEDLWWFLVANAEDPQAALCETWAITPSWQSAVPDGGTAFGFSKLIAWIADTYGVRDDWLYTQNDPAIMSDADQIRLAYRVHEEWRDEFPNAMSDAAEAEALLSHLGTRASGSDFLARNWVADRLLAKATDDSSSGSASRSSLAKQIAQPGINILGHFSYPSGLRISTESIVEGLRANDVAYSLRNVPVALSTDDPIGHHFSGMEVHDTTLIHIQPEPLFTQAYQRGGLNPRTDGVYRIGYWYWEFDEIPSSWNRAAFECDELWTATDFIAEGLRARYRQPVHVLFPGVEIAPFEKRSRASFGLDGEDFVFLFVFHMTSVMDRKNPLGLIKAFKAAFPKEKRARLVIKTTFGERHPEALKVLEAAAADANIQIINRTFSRDETLSLIAACDAYVSLHRSEGLGLTMAEAMLLGRPVVATGFSGNCAFMDDRNSLLVDHRIITLDRDIPPYKAGQRWAEPSVAHAARQMRKLFDQPEFARELGATAKTDLEQRLNFRVTGKPIAERLAQIAAMK